MFAKHISSYYNIAYAVTILICLFAAHIIMERVHHRYCRSNMLLVMLWGDSTYCTMLSYTTKMVETFVFTGIHTVLRTTTA